MCLTPFGLVDYPNYSSDYRLLFEEETNSVYKNAYVYERFNFFDSIFDFEEEVIMEGKDKSIKLTCLFLPLPSSYNTFDLKSEKTSEKEITLTLFKGVFNYGYIFASFKDKVHEEGLKEYVKKNIFVV